MGKAAIQFDIERRMSEELERQGKEAGWDRKLTRALERAHKKWQARFPEIYEKWWNEQLREAALSLNGLYDGPAAPPKLTLVKSQSDH